jgi:hypothetical protein
MDTMPAALLTHMLAQKLMRVGIDNTDAEVVPLHFHQAADPSWRHAVVRGFHLHAAIQMNDAFTVLVIAEGRYIGNIAANFIFRRAVNACIGPAASVIRPGLQTLARSLQRRFGRADTDSTFSIRILRHGMAVTPVREHILKQRSSRLQISAAATLAGVENDKDCRRCGGRLFMQPADARTRSNVSSRTDFAAIAQRRHKRVRRYITHCGSRTIGPVP